MELRERAYGSSALYWLYNLLSAVVVSSSYGKIYVQCCRRRPGEQRKGNYAKGKGLYKTGAKQGESPCAKVCSFVKEYTSEVVSLPMER